MVDDEHQEKDFLTTGAYAVVVQFPGDVEGRNPTLVDLSNDSVHEIGIINAMRGKRCIGCTGSNWFLVLDDITRECYLTSLFITAPAQEDLTVVPLPPMPPEDDDQLQLELRLFNCVLSSTPAPTTAGCIVVLGLVGETYLRYCRIGDEAWSHVEVTFDDYCDAFDGAVAFHGGKLYATTRNSYSVVIDASAPAPAPLRVERTDVKIPGPFPFGVGTRQHLVATAAASPDDDGGQLYSVRANFFGYPEQVVGADVCRWDPAREVWLEAATVGGTTLFVGRNCLAVSSPATEAAETTESNCIYILRTDNNAVRVFTFALRDMTIRCSLYLLGIEEDDYDCDDTNPSSLVTNAYWSIPGSCRRFKLEVSKQGSSSSSSEGNVQDEKSVAAHPAQVTSSSSECPQQWWLNLPMELLAKHVVPKLSFIDFLHLKSVCKDWSRIWTPIRDTKAWPLLVMPAAAHQPRSIARNGGSSLDVFDPVSKNKYTLSVQVPGVVDGDSASLMLHGSKKGWLLVSRGHSCFFLTNPFSRGGDAVVVLPPVNDLVSYKGISFCSTPGSLDFMVMIIEGRSWTDDDRTTIGVIRTWRPGQASWEQHGGLDCGANSFLVATHNPLFLDGEFYCLARDGKLGAFNPWTMAWRVLDGLEPIVCEAYATGEEGLSACLVEWKGEVVAVLRYTDVEDPIDVFQLDRKRMAWSKREELEDGAIFWDRKQAAMMMMMPSWSGFFSCNKVYEPTFSTGTHDDGVRECVFYSLETKQYSNGSYSLYGLKEPVNAVWFEPNLDDYK